MKAKGKITRRPYDSAEFLVTQQAIAAYLADALSSGSSAEFQDALNVVARARGMTEIAMAAATTKMTKIRSKPPARDDHCPKAKTPARRSVFHDLFPAEEAAKLEIRSTLLNGLKHWLASSAVTQAKAAEVLGITYARVSEIKRSKINHFSLDLLIRLAARAGLQPKLTVGRVIPRFNAGSKQSSPRPTARLPARPSQPLDAQSSHAQEISSQPPFGKSSTGTAR